MIFIKFKSKKTLLEQQWQGSRKNRLQVDKTESNDTELSYTESNNTEINDMNDF